MTILPYLSPADSPRARPLILAILAAYRTILVTALLALVFYNVVVIFPRFRGIFRDFRTNLPPLTECMLAFSGWFANSFGWLIVAFILYAIVTLWSILDWKTRVHKVRWHHIIMPMFFALLLTNIWTFLQHAALMLPFMKLMAPPAGSP